MIQFARRFYDDVKLETFFESCGVADLITTCYGGRNRIAGEEFVKGKVCKYMHHLPKDCNFNSVFIFSIHQNRCSSCLFSYIWGCVHPCKALF